MNLPPLDDLILAVWEQARINPRTVSGQCVYATCIVGRAAAAIGYDLTPHDMTGNNIQTVYGDDQDGYEKLPAGPLRWLAFVQEAQDCGHPWADSVAEADTDAQGQPWLESLKEECCWTSSPS